MTIFKRVKGVHRNLQSLIFDWLCRAQCLKIVKRFIPSFVEAETDTENDLTESSKVIDISEFIIL